MSQSIFRTKPLAKLLEKGYIKETGKKDLQMNPFIACCGLDCEKCEARLDTINNDGSLREKVAKEWSELNKVEITPQPTLINLSLAKPMRNAYI